MKIKLKKIVIICALSIPFTVKSQQWKMQSIPIQTQWSKHVNEKSGLIEYPRPQLKRTNWRNLNGLWEYAIATKNSGKPSSYDGKILVPYPIESALSGVKKSLRPDQSLWYKKIINHSKERGKKTILHFGAVDWEAKVFLNRKLVGTHLGGYTGFSFDVTSFLKFGNNELLVQVYDPTDQGMGPRGKQTLNPANIYYTPSSGIWQSVWMENVPIKYIKSLKITPDVDKGMVNVQVIGSGNAPIQIKVLDGKKVVARLSGLRPSLSGQKTSISINIPNAKLWSPDDPFLYDLEVTLGQDKIKSYFGMRKIAIQKDEKGIDRIFLNNKYTYNLGTLDQGFWPEGLYTAPTDAALAFDINAIKSMGFNTIRKHIKVEPARWYYWADKLGMLVWQDMVNPGSDSELGKKQFENGIKESIDLLYNFPSIVTWVLFNEKWGQYDQERLTKEIKALDPTRIINGHSGEMLYVNNQLRSESPNAWVASDMTDVHAYPFPGHMTMEKGKAAAIGEFGGIGVPIEGHLWDDLVAGWGYDGVVTPKELQIQYTQMIDTLKQLERYGLTASIYTQPFDVESEQNGLITYDREIIKLKLDTIRAINQKLWPITANWKVASVKSLLKVAEQTEKDYNTRLFEYRNGNRDLTFLRSLAITANARKDEKTVDEVSNTYIRLISDPFIESNLRFIVAFTGSSGNAGFRILFDNVSKVNAILGNDEAENVIKKIIEWEEIKPFEKNGAIPNWIAIEKNIISKYRSIGEEVAWQTETFYAVNRKDWSLFGKAGKKWFEKYGKFRKGISQEIINQVAWRTFSYSEDVSALEAALAMTSEFVSKENAFTYILDTHANLLYKLDRKVEALAWQEKAIAREPQNEEFKANYDKMKLSLPTWTIKK